MTQFRTLRLVSVTRGRASSCLSHYLITDMKLSPERKGYSTRRVIGGYEYELWLNASEYTLGCRLLDLGVVQFGCRNIISGYLYTRSGLFDRDTADAEVSLGRIYEQVCA